MRKLPAVVMDANVLVQAPLRDTLLRLAEGPTVFHVRWSDKIFDEVTRTPETKFGIAPARTAHLESELRKHFPEAWIEGFEPLIPEMLNDRKDRHILAAAVHAKARTIVTYNLRHFPPEATRPWRVTAIGPSAFLKRLYLKHPGLVTQTLEAQAAGLRRTFSHQLMVLRQAVPAFIDLFCLRAGISLD